MRNWILLELSHFGNKRSSCVLNGENKLCLFLTVQLVYAKVGCLSNILFAKHIADLSSEQALY